jgi:Arc/MetJ-type ribon-helix-helix transcriptional regulator
MRNAVGSFIIHQLSQRRIIVPTKKTKESRRFVSSLFDRRKGIFQRNPCSGEEIIESLLEGDVDTINSYLETRSTQSFSAYCLFSPIIETELYVVSLEDGKLECFLGEDFLYTFATLGSEDQLRATFDWHQKTKTPESGRYTNIDDWVRFCLEEALAHIDWYSKMIAAPRTPWVDMYIDQGKRAQNALVNLYQGELRELREEGTYLRMNSAPEFILQEHGEKVSRTKLIIQRLCEVTAS